MFHTSALRSPFVIRFFSAALWAGSASLSFGAAGLFVIPAERDSGNTRFSYWDRWTLPPGITQSYRQPHYPAVGTGIDDNGNESNYNTGVSLQQVKNTNAFIASMGSIYSYDRPNGFEVNYTHSGTDPVAGVVFQIDSAGYAPAESSIRLKFTPAGGTEPVLLAPKYRALDDPGTGSFDERVIRGYEWDVIGLNVADYQILFECEYPHMAFFQAQLDTTTGPAFHQALGWLLTTRPYPAVRHETAGKVDRNLPSSAETRFFLTGAQVPLTADPSSGFEFVGWLQPDGTVLESTDPYTVEFNSASPSDLTAGAIFSPTDWDTFRYHFFLHGNSLIQQPDDYGNNAVSGPEVDHDKDGFSNYAEYVFGGDPYTRDAARMTPVPSTVTVDGVTSPAITYRRQAAAESSIRYVVEQSSDLSTWISNTPENTIIGETPGPLEADGTRLVTARSLTGSGSGPAPAPVFLRVRALPASLPD